VPSGVVFTANPDGSATVEAPRAMAKQHLHTFLHRLFGNRACWPFARGRRWLVKINPPAEPSEAGERAA
jgi:hypothetical protein